MLYLSHEDLTPLACKLLDDIQGIYNAERYSMVRYTCKVCGKPEAERIHKEQEYRPTLCSNCHASAMIKAWSEQLAFEVSSLDPIFHAMHGL